MINKIKYIVLLLFVVICSVFYSLSETEYEHEMKLVTENYKLEINDPPIPDRDENEKDFFGIDKNNNGVRDDIELWTKYNFKNEVLRKNLFDVFRTLRTLHTDLDDKTLTMQNDKYLINYFCILGYFVKGNNDPIFEKLSSHTEMFYNNRKRKVKAEAFEIKHLSKITEYPSDQECEKIIKNVK